MDMGPGKHRVKPRGRHRAPERSKIFIPSFYAGTLALAAVLATADAPPLVPIPPAQAIEPHSPISGGSGKASDVTQNLEVSQNKIINRTVGKIGTINITEPLALPSPEAEVSEPTPSLSESPSVAPSATASSQPQPSASSAPAPAVSTKKLRKILKKILQSPKPVNIPTPEQTLPVPSSVPSCN